jgi:hypothetical protein
MHYYRAPISYIALSHGRVRSLETCTPSSPGASTVSNLDPPRNTSHCAITEQLFCASGSPSDHSEMSSIASWLFVHITRVRTWRFIPGTFRLHLLDRTFMTRILWLSRFWQLRPIICGRGEMESSSCYGTNLTSCSAARDSDSSHWAHQVSGRLIYYHIMITSLSHKFC